MASGFISIFTMAYLNNMDLALVYQSLIIA